MSEVLVRNLDESVVDQLKARAQGNGRSLQAELKLILEQAARGLPSTKLTRSAYRTLAEELRSRLGGGTQSDSAELIAEDRAR